jgi:hypothetical protein
MRASEILRGLADLIDNAEGGGINQTEPLNTVVAEPDQVTQQKPEEHDVPGREKFLPPLQAKLEILKKSVGMENVYDEGDELAQIKKRAGIPPAVTDEAASDGPLEV